MLVLSRKQNEEILIGENVSIRVLGVSGNKVRIGIMAPNAVEIRRAELDLREDRDNYELLRERSCRATMSACCPSGRSLRTHWRADHVEASQSEID